MTDIMSKEKRSYTMSRIRSKWTAMEKLLHNKLKGRKIKHKMHPKIEGSPDIILHDQKIAIFLDGCFWHWCPKCKSKKPTTNAEYWKIKIEKNIKRDKENQRKLKKGGWQVIRFWEHEIKEDLDSCIKHIERLINNQQ